QPAKPNSGPGPSTIAFSWGDTPFLGGGGCPSDSSPVYPILRGPSTVQVLNVHLVQLFFPAVLLPTGKVDAQQHQGGNVVHQKQQEGGDENVTKALMLR